MIEIERKFLVNSNEYRRVATSSQRLIQGFLNTDPERTVRVRIAGDRAVLTVKGLSDNTGLTRFEWETTITVQDAEELLRLSETTPIRKTRFLVPEGRYYFEVDEFEGDNDGLVLAEIELESTTADFEKPHWLGEEVTGDPKYYNSELSKKPYQSWRENQ